LSAIKRPYLNLSTKELYDLFKSSLDDEIHLQTILAELSFRKTTSARKLEGDIKKALSTDVFAKPETILDPRNRSESHDRNVTSGHRLTDEQRVAVGYFKSQKSLKINAFAGAGKTSTLMAMSKASKRTGLYLAFNRSIANEAALKFPKYVNCRTTHSLAYKSVAGIFSKSNEKLIGTTNVNAINQYLKLGDLVIDNRKIPAITIAGMISRTLQKFKQSNDERIRNSHLPSVVGPVNQLADKSKKVLAQKIVEEAHQIWSKMIDPSSPIPLGHDGYLIGNYKLSLCAGQEY